MRKNLVVGILAETKNEWERRTPLTPKDVAWLVQRQIHVEVISSSLRIHRDAEFRRAGGRIVKTFRKANLLLGIKEPPIPSLVPKSVYMVFSHTTKGQIHNRSLLRSIMNKRITLIDYEHIIEPSGERLVYFGRFAGIAGMIDTLSVFGQKIALLGYANPFSSLKGAIHYQNFEKAKTALRKIARSIHTTGFHRELTPLIIGITGHGNVSRGAQEILDILDAETIHPRDLRQLITKPRQDHRTLFKLVFQREEKLRSRDKKGFYFEEYLKNPRAFESNMDRYLPHLSILINASYWDERYPRLVTEKMLRRLNNRSLSLSVIGDLSCDISGTIQITKQITTPAQPAIVYNPATGKFKNDLSSKGIAVMAIDNLPAEFPRESSNEFSGQIRDYVYQIAAHGIIDITNHHAIPREIRGAVIAQDGRLTQTFKYLSKLIRT